VRLFTTLIRFDAVYYGHFKCNLRRIADYPNLSNWLREMYQWPGGRDGGFQHIKALLQPQDHQPDRDCAEGAIAGFHAP
jgi:glutathionyl-hydroquinone reductase